MTSISKSMYIDKLDDLVNKYNNRYHSTTKTTKMKYIDVKSSTYIDSNNEINDQDPKPDFGDVFRKSKHKTFLHKAIVPNLPQEAFVFTKVKNTILWTYVISEKTNNLLERVTIKSYKKQIQKILEMKC